eukprot:CAMPEP_0176449004 /NCGR_PEP_ID=MMETSP0127-20121128/26179_1 /TAXON_ID=938130 /ORGANISM="Platyophrya macrostoma, Strain WH" /LENGTH=383 /DNA_ID=CAMNT_0017836179 /DNA_START=90 /DNA_END=1241 /DNA_ORIENTATION=-
MGLHGATLAIVASIFVASGTISTISSKWQDDISAVGRACPSDEPNCASGKSHVFDHPFVQTWFMFLGEFLCMIICLVQRLYKKWNEIPLEEGVDYMKPVPPFIFMIPSLCDFTASTTMYIGLTLTEASVYQMLRGATVVFTGLMSIVFLKRRFQLFEWLGMVLVTSGLACVGLASMLFASDTSSATNPVLGDILIFAAQLIVAGQMVIEEKILTKYNVPPTLLVGWEGTFGLCYASLALGIFQAWPKSGPSLNGHNPPDDFIDAAMQMQNDYRLIISNVLCVIAITFLNSAGQTITKNISATARMVLDTVRNVIVWGFCLAIPFFNEKFQWMQLVGFILLIGGNAIFKRILTLPCEILKPKDLIDVDVNETKRLMDNDAAVNV